MRQLSSGERYKSYIDTLNRCGVYLLNLSDEEIGYNIFEEFDIGIVSFLYHNNLKLFEDEGMIDGIISEKSSTLRIKVMELQGSTLWNIESVKTSKEWLEILNLSDEIKDLIRSKWSDTELQALFTH